MHVDVRDIEAVGERGCESCAGIAGWAMVGGYVALGSEAGGAAAVEEAGCRVRYRYLHRNGASG